ncbi:MAG: hypothetical protein DI598_01690 [Pseudopedobacter saltans]|uniref:DUF2975 domain-containing protein n=1 Tax=Pseudopedobacter saltans TaxID=151895 RepID=A0A2W5HE97_9SPHI|nr:MAG: hypothetical protein DI598_01690 [Pseudopedobacter saltans]
MEEKKLKRVRNLVILLKIIMIGYFLFSIYSNKKDFVDGFKDGWNSASYDSVQRSKSQLVNYVSVTPLKDTLIDAGVGNKVVGISQFMVASSKNNNIFIIEGFMAFVTAVTGIFLIVQIFKLLNNLQRLKIFDKVNISILRRIVGLVLLTGVAYNIWLVTQNYNKLKDVSITGYIVESFSIMDLDFSFVVYMIVIYIVSIIWDYSIDVKSEHALTV